MKMTLLRHGSRDLTVASDGGLNRAGHETAQSLIALLDPDGKLPVPTILIASPKRRARETLQPLSEALNLTLQVEPMLDERHPDESSFEFRSRVRNFLEQLPKRFTPQDVLYICSHADWLEEAISLLPTDIPDAIAECGFACGETRSFEMTDKLWEFLG